MAVFRGGKGYYHARRKLKNGELPISGNNDDSVLWGQRVPDVVTGEPVAQQGDGWQQGDYLVYGWRPYAGTLGGLSIVAGSIAFVQAIAHFSHGQPGWIPIIFLIIAALFYYYIARARFHRFVIFDRRHGLVHLPRFFSRRQDSIRWQDADFWLIDVKGGVYFDTTHTELITTRPPWDLRTKGIPPFWRHIMLTSASSDDSNNAPTEPAFRHIVEFMTAARTSRMLLDELISMDCYVAHTFNNDFRRTRKKAGRLFSLLDPESLADKPNWLRGKSGNWEKVGRGTCARAGWFGLWGQTHTLPPHLKGTKADPDYKDDPNAPGPGLRWLTPENDMNATAELAGQPLEVIEAVLLEGMPALDRFPDARARAQRARAGALARQTIRAAVSHDGEEQEAATFPEETRSTIKKLLVLSLVVGGALALGVIGGMAAQ